MILFGQCLMKVLLPWSQFVALTWALCSNLGNASKAVMVFFFCTSRQVFVTSSKETGDDRRSRNPTYLLLVHTIRRAICFGLFFFLAWLQIGKSLLPLTDTFHQFHKYHTQRKLEYVGIVYYFPQGWINLVPTLG